MPSWFVILAKVFSMLAYLVPFAEKTFGNEPGSGQEKKQFVMDRVNGWLDTPQAFAAGPTLNEDQLNQIKAHASVTIDNMVLAANESNAWQDPTESIG